MNSIPQTKSISQNDKPQSNVADDFKHENSSLGNDANIAAAHKRRVKKFKLFGYAKHLLIKHNVRNRNGTQPHRTRFCHAVKARNEQNVILKLNANDINSEATLGRVQTCGSVWSCPVCAARKAVEKGRQVRDTIAWAEHNGLIPVMVTVTARHHYRMPLIAFKGSFKAAWAYFTNRRAWKAFKKNYGVAGWIANREVPHGGHGWHYHMHFLIFVEKSVLALGIDLALEKQLTPHWLRALEREGLDGLSDYALKVTAHGNVGEFYLTKLGVTVASDDDDLHYELTGGMNKKGSRTIWDILRHARYGDEASEKLYIEYVVAMQGDNFITTSRGLNDAVQNYLDELAEPELEKNDMKVWAHFSEEAWSWVVAANAYSDVLDCAARYRSIGKLTELLYNLRDDLKASGKLPIRTGAAVQTQHLGGS